MGLLKSVIADARSATPCVRENISPPAFNTGVTAPKQRKGRAAQSPTATYSGLQAGVGEMSSKPATARNPGREPRFDNSSGNQQKPPQARATTRPRPGTKPRASRNETQPGEVVKPSVAATPLAHIEPVSQTPGETPTVSLQPRQQLPAQSGYQPHKTDPAASTGDEIIAPLQQKNVHSPVAAATPLSSQTTRQRPVAVKPPDSPGAYSARQLNNPEPPQSHSRFDDSAIDQRGTKSQNESGQRAVASESSHAQVDNRQTPPLQRRTDSEQTDNNRNELKTAALAYSSALADRPTDTQSIESNLRTEEILPQSAPPEISVQTSPQMPLVESRSSSMMSDQFAQQQTEREHIINSVQTTQQSADVRIGQVDVFIERSTPSSSTGGRVFRPAISMASRQYLRKL